MYFSGFNFEYEYIGHSKWLGITKEQMKIYTNMPVSIAHEKSVPSDIVKIL